MTRTISIITATVGAALLFALPAYGDSWGADKAAQVDTRSEGLNKHYGLGEYATVEPAAVSTRSDGLNRYYGLGEYANPVDAREQALTAKSEAQLASTPAPDWFERSANAAIRDNRGVFVADDRFDLHPQQVPTTVTATSSGRDIDVPQIGIGLGVGLLLALGLFLAMKYTRIRPVAH